MWLTDIGEKQIHLSETTPSLLAMLSLFQHTKPMCWVFNSLAGKSAPSVRNFTLRWAHGKIPFALHREDISRKSPKEKVVFLLWMS